MRMLCRQHQRHRLRRHLLQHPEEHLVAEQVEIEVGEQAVEVEAVVEQEGVLGAQDKAGDKDKAIEVDGAQSVAVEVVRLRLRRVVQGQRLPQRLHRRRHRRLHRRQQRIRVPGWVPGSKREEVAKRSETRTEG
jgi:hypothetical protein